MQFYLLVQNYVTSPQQNYPTPPQQQYNSPPLHTKIKISDPPNRGFSKIFNFCSIIAWIILELTPCCWN